MMVDGTESDGCREGMKVGFEGGQKPQQGKRTSEFGVGVEIRERWKADETSSRNKKVKWKSS
jgi:hypothetical protein